MALELKRLTNVDCDTSEEESALRVQLAACYQLFDYLGWSESIFNHISVRIPGPARHFLINPFGLNYNEVTASNLVKIDLAGRQVDGAHGVNYAGFIIHAAIHAVRDDAHCIMHTHTTAGAAVASKADGLSRSNFYGAMLANSVGYHDFEGVTVRPDEQPRLVASLGNKPILILRNHGLLVAGPNIASAFSTMWEVQRACEIQVQADSMRGANTEAKPEVYKACADLHDGYDNSALTQKVFDAMIRRMESRRGQDYKI